MSDQTTIHDALQSFCLEQPQGQYTSRELIDGVLGQIDVRRESVMPYDYCYNHENKGSSPSKLFLRVGRGLFAYVGPDYKPTADSPKGRSASPEAMRVYEALTDESVDLTVGRILGPEYEYGSLPLALTDAIFSLALRYEPQVVPVVHSFAGWLGVPLAPGGASVGTAEALARLETLLGDDIVVAFGGTRYRTSSRNGILKAEAVRQALAVLAAHQIDDFDDLRPDNPAVRAAERDFARIPGQGRLTAWVYFLMLAGDEDGVKPDRHLLGFVAKALGVSAVTDEQCVSLVREVAQLLSDKHPWMTPRRLEHAIWWFGKVRAQERSSRARRPH